MNKLAEDAAVIRKLAAQSVKEAESKGDEVVPAFIPIRLYPTTEAAFEDYRKMRQEEDINAEGCTHEGGIGWNPNGVWCGECTRASGKGCPNLDKTEEIP